MLSIFKQDRSSLQRLPGFNISIGITLSWVGFIIVLPIAALFIKASEISPQDAWVLLTRPAALRSFQITMFYAVLCATINTFVGLIVAWTLVRKKFVGSKILDSLIDLPFALPGAVGGIALVTVFSKNGIIGKFIYDVFGTTVIYNQFGILIGLLFVTLPFAVRSVQPLIQELSVEEAHAAHLLGASNFQIFTKVQLPYLLPGLFSAFILSLAKSIGEYGTVIFVAGNIPLKSEVISRYIYNKIDQYDLPGATMVAVVLLSISLLIIACFNMLQHRWRQRFE